MAKRKLGEILLERGLIEPAQLKKALDAQLIFGGKLGTNLIELGYVDEPTIAAALDEQMSSGIAGQDLFGSIPSSVIRMLPKKLVERHRVVPLSVTDKELTVAMPNPSDLVLLDEIGFVSGMRVKPLVAPEARLLDAMETYYGIPRPVRFVTLSEEMAREDSGESQEEAPQGPWAVDIGRPETPEAAEALEVVEAAHAEDRPAEEREAARQTLDELQEQARRAGEARGEARLEVLRMDLDAASEAMAQVETRDEIGDILADFAAPRFERAALFILQKSRVLGWKARGASVSADRLRAVVVPRDLPSVFDALSAGTGYYLGEMEDLPGNELILEGLGGGRPEVAFVLPVPFQDRDVAALYGDGTVDRLRNLDVRSFRTVVAKAGMAMEMLLLRHRILQ